MNAMTLHATCVAVQGQGIVLLGAPGSGKSDLALRLIDKGAQLVADDQVMITVENNVAVASAPPSLQGLLEVRGVGIFRMPYIPHSPLACAVQLVAREEIERLPEPAFFDCLGLKLPLHLLHAFDASTDAKIRCIVSHKRMPI